MLKSEEIDLIGRKFTIRTLKYGKAREVYSKLQNILLAYVDDEAASFGAVMGAMMGGAISDADFDFIVERFGEETTVVSYVDGKEHVIPRLNKEAREDVFAGEFQAVFDWLEACIQLNFAGVVKKLEAVKPAVAEAKEKLRAATGLSAA